MIVYLADGTPVYPGALIEFIRDGAPWVGVVETVHRDAVVTNMFGSAPLASIIRVLG